MLLETKKENIIWGLEGILHNGKRWFVPINRNPFRIGRSKDCHLSLSCDTISRDHAEIIHDNNSLFIHDLSSGNGTYLNNKKITKKTRIKGNDIIHFDELEFRVTSKKISELTSIKETQKGIGTAQKSLPNQFVNCEYEFHKMLSQEEIVPYFQPIVTLDSTCTIGYEILARCFFKGLPSNPGELFKIAAKLGYEVQLSEIIRKKGVSLGKALPYEYILFFNTDPNEIFRENLIMSLYEMRRLDPRRNIVLEIHEKTITNIKSIKRLRSILSELNMNLAYDDFGSGQSRLIELSEVPPDYLKFDMSLIRNIHTACQRKQQMVERLVKMAHDFGIRPLAEGIESKQELDICIQLGFTNAQGFFFGGPTSINEL